MAIAGVGSGPRTEPPFYFLHGPHMHSITVVRKNPNVYRDAPKNDRMMTHSGARTMRSRLAYISSRLAGQHTAGTGRPTWPRGHHQRYRRRTVGSDWRRHDPQ